MDVLKQIKDVVWNNVQTIRMANYLSNLNLEELPDIIYQEPHGKKESMGTF